MVFRSSIFFIFYFLINLGYISAQVYYPAVEWLQKGPALMCSISPNQPDLFAFRKNIKGQARDTLLFGVQKLNELGNIQLFDSHNSIRFYSDDLVDLNFLSIKSFNQTSENPIEFLLTPSYHFDSLISTKPILAIYDTNFKEFDTISVNWNFQNYFVYDGIKVDSFYYFILAENVQSDLNRKYYSVKTDQNLNVLVKYPFSTLLGQTAKLHYWRGSIIIFGGSVVYEQILGYYKQYPTLFLYNPNNLDVVAKRVYKTPLDYDLVRIIDLNSLGDSILIGFTQGDNSNNFILKLDSNYFMLDSIANVSESYLQPPVLLGQKIKGINSYSQKAKLYFFNYDFNAGTNVFQTYDIGVYNVSSKFTFIRKGGNYVIYGNKFESDISGEGDGYRIFRITLDSAGRPLKIRDSANYIPPVLKLENILSIYPNPTQGFFTININTIELPMILTVNDIYGRIIYQITLEKSDTTIPLNLSPGIYYFSIQSNLIKGTKTLFVNE